VNTTSKADAEENILWPGATPLLARVSRQNPFGLRGSLPATVCAPLQANFPAIPRPQCRKFLLEQIDGAHMHDPESNRGQRPHASTETARTHDREASALAIGSWLALLPSIAFALVLARRTPLKTSFFAATCPLCRVGEQRSGKTLANQETEEELVCQILRVSQSRRLLQQILVLTICILR